MKYDDSRVVLVLMYLLWFSGESCMRIRYYCRGSDDFGNGDLGPYTIKLHLGPGVPFRPPFQSQLDTPSSLTKISECPVLFGILRLKCLTRIIHPTARDQIFSELYQVVAYVM